MRIVFFHAYPHQYAGAQRLTHALAVELSRRGHSTAVVVPDEGPFPAYLRQDGVEVVVASAPSNWRAYGRALERSGAAAALCSLPGYWRRLGSALRQLRPDLIHVNDHRGILLSGPAGVLARVPVVWHLHGTYESLPITLLGRAVARRIIVVSNATRREQRGLPRGRSKVVVLPNGLIGGDAAPISAGPVMVHARRLVVTGARHHPDKGLDVLIRAAATIRLTHGDVQVVIAGAEQPGYEEHHRQLVDLVQQLGLGDTVSFTRVADPLELWRLAAVYVQPSRREPFGLGVIEAMSVGTPVVVTPVGGLGETVVGGRSGLHVPPDEPDALAQAICRILDDDELAHELSLNGLERAKDYTLDKMVTKLVATYEEATAPRLGPSR